MAATSPVNTPPLGVDVNSRPGGGVLAVAQTTANQTTAYTANRAVGGLLTFGGATVSPGGSCLIVGMTINEAATHQDASLELWLFNQTFTPMADNAAWTPSAADQLNCIGVIPSGGYNDTTTGSVSTRNSFTFPAVLAAAGTGLFGQLVTRGTPTYTSATALKVTLQVVPG